MNLNKDNRNIYTADSGSYAEHMQENRKEPRDLLSSFIKFLLLILLVVMSYFFYNIVKNDLSFSDVFNKQELVATYEFLNTNEMVDNSLRVEFEEPKEIIALAVTKKHIEPVVKEKEIQIEKEPVTPIEEIIVEEQVVEIEKPKAVEIIEEIKEEIIVERVVVKATEVITTKEPIKETTLSENYLELMAEELKSL